MKKRYWKFWNSQIKKDDRAIEKIEKAGQLGDFKAIKRAEKKWRKEEQKDWANFNRE
jgi:hypothetical protein